jgi:O-antigen/teichoic acid export membrane protein
MKKKYGFYSSLGLLVLLNAIIKPLWIFAIDRQVQNVVGTETYGIYFSLFSLSVVLSFLADLGFTVFFNRQLAASEMDFQKHPGSFLFLKLILAVVYCGVLFIAGLVAGIKRWDLLLYIALIQVFTSLLLFFRSIITARQWFGADAWLSIADKSMMIALCGSLLWFPAVFGFMTIEKFLLFQAACLAAAMFIALFYLMKKGTSFTIKGKWWPGTELVSRALPFGLIVLLMSAHSRADAFLLERMHSNGAYEAGVYAASFRLLDAANMCGYLFASFLLPYIARRWSKKEEISSVVLQCRHLLLLFSVTLVVITVFEAPWIHRALYHHNDAYATEVLQWCLPAIIGYSLVQVYGTVLTATGHLGDLFMITLAALVINIILNLLLIPSLGAKGCCIAALFSQCFYGLMAMLYTKQKTGVPLHLRSLLIYTFTTGLLSVFFIVFRNWPVAIWLLIIAAGMITAVVAIAARLIDIRTLLRRLPFQQK